MRVRFFSYFYPPCIGGGEVILQHQAEELARRGHEVHVHTTPFTNMDGSTQVECGEFVEGGVHVYRRPSRWAPGRNPLEKNAVTPDFLRDSWLAADLLVCVGYPSLHLDLLSARCAATGTPLVVQNYITADFLREILDGAGGVNKRLRAAYWRRWVRPLLSRASVVIADSPAATAALSSELGLDNVRTHIGMAVDPAEFDAVTPARRRALREKLGLGSAKLVVAPSRLSRQKGADLLVDAFLPLARDGWKLVIAGPVNEPEFAATVREAALPCRDIVITELPREEQVALIAEASIVALPSRGETVGGVVFEGMYAGALCIVSSAVEAARDDYLQDGENGLLVESESVPALRSALSRAMAEPLSAVRAAGRRLVETRFTWPASVDRLLEIYPRA
ncbi:MAG: glycosyltransferase family 4 protein [Deltaproteobacteria bacterium]|nr:glycosyltransferase family 4 protein [Deltaproteobacteria bacterium]